MLLITAVVADVSFIVDPNREHDYKHHDTTTTSTPPPPPHPYVFSYSAGRYPGHVDRTHSEVSDGSGTVKGAYSYVDPRQQIRTVEYVADKNGFHPILSHQPKAQEDSEAVKLAKVRHFALYNKIAERNSHPAMHVEDNDNGTPKDTLAVLNAKNRHYNLYDKIAMEHAHIAAEREAERLAYEATSSPINAYEHNNQYE